MKPWKLSSISLLWRILFSTSLAITVLFAAMGWVLQEQFVRIASLSLEQEARASFQAYNSLWQARADELATVSQLLSRMPDVRAVLITRDRATIRDTAQEVWDKLARPGALYLICDPGGQVIASMGATAPAISEVPFVRGAAKSFPHQARGFQALGGGLYQVVVTPVYVATSQDAGLLNVLVAAVAVDRDLGNELKSSTGGTDFLFLEAGRVAASTLAPDAERDLTAAPASAQQVRLAGSDYYQFASVLTDVEGHPAGELRILRPFEAAQARIRAVRMRLTALWLVAIVAGFALTYLLARRLLQPVHALDRAASEIAQGNYAVRVPMERGDEIGRLAETFNGMCESLIKAREELIRQERLTTIGRLSASIVHDLRNPLAAIYGGAEMLVDSDLSEAQIRRLSSNIYRASRQIQDLLHELADVTQGRAHARETCRLRDVVVAACEPLAASADSSRVQVRVDVPADIELPLDRSPMERVFQNLIGNAIEAMPEGGSVVVRAQRNGQHIDVSVEDDGPGIPAAIARQLFQPFVTAGKPNGLGLGLALSRKTVLSHGGDLWAEDPAEPSGPGACFRLRLPL
ncbi:MAG TPA: HAMP domain-containing sensor histidine kinase [Bryobacteraceae bacterium]|nr:HAMP domain-containing sensor histidine kinase [Bryobacteraceae bacterium]